MLYPFQDIFEQIPVFILVLFRLGGIIVMAPFLGAAAIPVKVKALLALILAMALFPLVPPVTFAPTSLTGLSVGVAGEMLIGIIMGFVLSLLFTGIQFGAEMISYQMGFAMARMVDPFTDVSTTVLSQFYMLLATLIYVLMNGPLILIRALTQTFQTVPLLAAIDNTTVLTVSVSVLTESFKLGIRIAGPVLVALFLATTALGFISRTMPQLNILAAGFPVRITLAFVILVASLGLIVMLFQDSLVIVFRQMGEIFI